MTKMDSITRDLTLNRNRLSEAQKESRALQAQYTDVEEAFRHVNGRADEIARLNKEQQRIVLAQKVVNYDLEGREADITKLEAEIVKETAAEIAKALSKKIKRAERAAIEADAMFAKTGVARKAVEAFIEAVTPLYLSAEHVGSNNPGDLAGLAIAGFFMDLCPNKFRTVPGAHTPGLGSHAEQHRTFSKSAAYLAVRAQKSRAGALAEARGESPATEPTISDSEMRALLAAR